MCHIILRVETGRVSQALFVFTYKRISNETPLLDMVINDGNSYSVWSSNLSKYVSGNELKCWI